MTVTYGFYDSLAGDRKYNAEQMSRLFEGIITDGVFQSIGGGLVVSTVSGMTVKVASGRAWFNNTWTHNDANLNLTIDASEVALNRIDRIIVEVNKDLGVRANTIKVLKGTPASSPAAPALANTTTLKQYALADIYVGMGVTTITGANITNKIGVAGGTPFITGIVNTIDVSTLLAQYESQFNLWMANLQDQLDDNQAGNLQNQINALVSVDNFGWKPVSGTWLYNTSKTVTIPSDGTLQYQKGWGVRYKQGGSFKYGYIVVLTATSMTIESGSDYAIANAPITDISYTTNPANAFGFPSYFNYTPTWTSDGVQPVLGNGTLTGRFTVVGRRSIVDITLLIGSTSTLGSSTYRIGIPIASTTDVTGVAILLDISIPKYYNGNTRCDGASMTVIAADGIVQHQYPFTFAAGDYIWGNIVSTF